ncbi:MAG: serine/threonine protein kinase [Opitutales bacterium]|nr:serine/threonine protein kinase [Opitutales bacterium]
MTSKPPDQLLQDTYRITKEIGEGINGVVYAGEDIRNGQMVALKKFRRGRGKIAFGLHELAHTVNLSHPRIVRCLDFFYEPGGNSLLVYEYIPDGNLRSYLSPSGASWSRGKITKLLQQILEGLDCLHRNNLIHGDIKPENILIAKDSEKHWRYLISDLGSARAVSGNRKIKDQNPNGSPAYMAPERFFDTYSFNADLYSLGVILFEILTGDLPFLGEVSQIARSHLKTPPDFEKIPDPMWKGFLASLMEKDPQKRISSAGDALKMLSLVSGGKVTVNASPATRKKVKEQTRGENLFAKKPYPFAEYQFVSSFSLPYYPLRMYPLLIGKRPGILCVQNAFLTWYDGLSGSPQSLYLPAHGDSVVTNEQNELLYQGPQGIYQWKPGNIDGELLHPTSEEIQKIAAGSTESSLIYTCKRGLNIQKNKGSSVSLPLENSILSQGIYTSEGIIYLFNGSTPTRMRRISSKGKTLSAENLPGCFLDSSPYPFPQVVFLANQKSSNSPSQYNLLRIHEGHISHFPLPEEMFHYEFLPNGFLFQKSNQETSFIDHHVLVHPLGKPPLKPNKIAYSPDYRHLFMGEQKVNSSVKISYFYHD